MSLDIENYVFPNGNSERLTSVTNANESNGSESHVDPVDMAQAKG